MPSYTCFHVSFEQHAETGFQPGVYGWFLCTHNAVNAHVQLMEHDLETMYGSKHAKPIYISECELANVNLVTSLKAKNISQTVWPNEEYNEGMLIEDAGYLEEDRQEFIKRMKDAGYDGGFVQTPMPFDNSREIVILYLFDSSNARIVRQWKNEAYLLNL